MNRSKRKYSEMSPAELDAIAAEFDREFIADTFHPMTPDNRKVWQRSKRRPGRPRVGKGAQTISVSVERSLLTKVDKLARQRGVSRALLIGQGLRAVLAKAQPGPKRRTG